jgi:hypothetical protein
MIEIALIASDLPVHLLADVADRLHDRAGCLEARFSWDDQTSILPVQWDGSLRLLQWGTHDRRSRLPVGAGLTLDQVAAGIVAGHQEVNIPASMGRESGTWFLIDLGIRGIVVWDRGSPVVYVLFEPSTNYYRNRTGQAPLMPVLVNQTI